MFKYIYVIFIFILFVLALVQFSSLVTRDVSKQKLRFKRRRRLNKLIVNDESKEVKEIDRVFERTGIKLKGKQYQLIRFFTIIILFIVWLFELILYKNNTMYFGLGILLYLISIPKERFLGLKTPFYYALKSYSNEFQKKKDLELYNIVSQVKNICISSQGNIGTDYILNEILKFTNHTKPLFLKFISLWNVNKKELAVEYFSSRIGSTIGEELAHILHKFDSLNSSELVEQLNIYQNNVRQEKETIRNKNQERQTTLFYALSVSVVMVVILNMLITIIFNSVFQQINYII